MAGEEGTPGSDSGLTWKSQRRTGGGQVGRQLYSRLKHPLRTNATCQAGDSLWGAQRG